MLQRIYYLFGFLFCLSLFACEKEEAPVLPIEQPGQRSYPNADEELWPYLQRFEDEGAKRGVKVDLSAHQLYVLFIDIGEDGVAGDCQFNPEDPNRLRVDRKTFGEVSEDFREYIIFHELGHCERLRKHKEDADNRNICLSIMASGVGGCRENYNASTREKLLDELFDTRFYGDWQ